jgi:hypothetical protein
VAVRLSYPSSLSNPLVHWNLRFFKAISNTFYKTRSIFWTALVHCSNWMSFGAHQELSRTRFSKRQIHVQCVCTMRDKNVKLLYYAVYTETVHELWDHRRVENILLPPYQSHPVMLVTDGCFSQDCKPTYCTPETYTRSCTQHIPWILRNPKFQCFIQRTLLPDPIGQIIPVHSLTFCALGFLSILFWTTASDSIRRGFGNY